MTFAKVEVFCSYQLVFDLSKDIDILISIFDFGFRHSWMYLYEVGIGFSRFRVL